MDAGEPHELIEFLQPYPDAVQALTLEARRALLAMLEPASEIIWDATNAVCNGFTFTESTNDCFFNLAVYGDHVTLIFPWGVNLIDSEQRLRGQGSRVRNIRMAGIETLQDPYVVDLILQAQRQAKRPSYPLEPQRIVKVMNGPKRRPKATS